MISTGLCDMLEIDAPVIQAAIWPAIVARLIAEAEQALGRTAAVRDRAAGAQAVPEARWHRPAPVRL